MRKGKRGEAEAVFLAIVAIVVCVSVGMWIEDKRIMQMAIDSHPHKPCVICNPPAPHRTSIEKPEVKP